MKNRRLNKRGKVLMTILTIMFSIAIYILMGKLGEEYMKYQMLLIFGWIWLFFGQVATYFFIWGE